MYACVCCGETNQKETKKCVTCGNISAPASKMSENMSNIIKQNYKRIVKQIDKTRKITPEENEQNLKDLFG